MAAPVSPALFDQFARGWRGYVVIAALALVSALFGAGNMPALDGEEARFALATRHMMEAPHAPVTDLVAHAAQALSVRVLTPHSTTQIWAYRVPSAFAFALAAIACLWAGKTLIEPRRAFMGAGLFTASLLAGLAGMIATPAALTLALTTAALGALAHLYSGRDKHARALAMTFWCACAVAFSLDVTSVFVVVLTAVAIAGWERRAAWLKPLAWWPAILCGVTLLVMIVTGGDRLAGDWRPFDHTHFALPGYHTLLLPLLAFPAVYAFPAVVRLTLEAVRSPITMPAPTRFLIAWIAPALALYELTPAKLLGDALPIYPAIGLFCGAGLGALLGRRWRSVHPVGLVLFGVTGAVLTALMAGAATFMPGDFGSDMRRAISAGLIGAIVVTAALAGLILLRRPAARAAVLILAAIVLSYSLREHLLPDARQLNVSGEAVAALTRQRLLGRADHVTWVIGYDEASLALLLRTPPRFTVPDEAGALARRGDAILVEGRARDAVDQALGRRNLAVISDEEPVRGLTLDDGRHVALTIGRVDSLSPADAPPQNP